MWKYHRGIWVRDMVLLIKIDLYIYIYIYIWTAKSSKGAFVDYIICTHLPHKDWRSNGELQLPYYFALVVMVTFDVSPPFLRQCLGLMWLEGNPVDCIQSGGWENQLWLGTLTSANTQVWNDLQLFKVHFETRMYHLKVFWLFINQTSYRDSLSPVGSRVASCGDAHQSKEQWHG